MAKVVRERAMRGDEMVTILREYGRKPGADVLIRNSHGFTETVKQRDLSKLPDDEPTARFTYEEVD